MLRKPRATIAFTVTAIVVSITAAVIASPATASLPTAAVALGDSFISGEGGGDYQPVVDVDGVAQEFPGWSAANTNPYFCHRSANASIQQAELPGIQARFNLACSGSQPHDIINASADRTKGRTVASQLAQLRQVATTHDIDLVLIGIGSNNNSFTFGDVATECAYRFIADAWTGWWEAWAYLAGPIKQEPCTSDDLATSAELDTATNETTAAVRELLRTLDEVDADGQHRVVFQDYTNPLPFDYAAPFHRQDNRGDGNDKFRALGAKRYAAGCPAHRASLAAGHLFSANLGRLVESVHATMSAEFPGADLTYLNVQHAFDGARLCEQPGSPDGALATPIRLQYNADGNFATSLSGYDKTRIEHLANTCLSHFQTCQESWHPNVDGYAVLGQCLAGAATTPGRSMVCARSDDGTISMG